MAERRDGPTPAEALVAAAIEALVHYPWQTQEHRALLNRWLDAAAEGLRSGIPIPAGRPWDPLMRAARRLVEARAELGSRAFADLILEAREAAAVFADWKMARARAALEAARGPARPS